MSYILHPTSEPESLPIFAWLESACQGAFSLTVANSIGIIARGVAKTSDLADAAAGFGTMFNAGGGIWLERAGYDWALHYPDGADYRTARVKGPELEYAAASLCASDTEALLADITGGGDHVGDPITRFVGEIES